MYRLTEVLALVRQLEALDTLWEHGLKGIGTRALEHADVAPRRIEDARCILKHTARFHAAAQGRVFLLAVVAVAEIHELLPLPSSSDADSVGQTVTHQLGYCAGKVGYSPCRFCAGVDGRVETECPPFPGSASEGS